ncbi:response regulator [Aurantiacibacter sp. MUD61]|uniref:response regulator n=1 Tax=Aurantiacibacter sp. MUD61 TaxID=3009083 RepID=UPI0022F01A75|nr:response regulator [Aurantiacibacter sp. MUD61]
MATKSAETKSAGKPFAHALIVEDDAILAMSLEDAFRRSGTHEVTVVSTMKATMEALNDGAKPDVIILDVHLADRDDGWAIAELVSLLGAKLPKIVFSTGAPQDIPGEIAEMGTVFEKPYDPDVLVEKLTASRRLGPFAKLRR